MKSKRKTLFASLREMLIHSFKMLASNWIRTILFFGGMTICVVLLTFVSLMATSSYKKIDNNFSCWPKNAFVMEGNIKDSELKKFSSDYSNFSANQFFFSSFQYNKQVSVCEIGVTENFLNEYLPEGDFQGIYMSEILYGREFNHNELYGYESAVMVNESTSVLLFGKKNCCFETLTIGTEKEVKQYKIVGILKDSYHSANNYESFVNSDDSNKTISIAAYTPVANSVKTQDGNIDCVIISTTAETSLASFSESDVVKKYFASSSYSIYSFKNIQKQYEQSIESFYRIYIPFSIILIIAEFVFALVFFFFSVKERVNEIGIRKAIGAKESHIIFQFMAENLILSLAVSFFGCLIGTIVFGIYILISEFRHVFIFSSISLIIVLLLFIFNIAFMTILSVIPGIISHKIKIVDALRFE